MMYDFSGAKVRSHMKLSESGLSRPCGEDDKELTILIVSGNGFQELIYQRYLAIELEKAGLDYVREKEHPIYYEDIEEGSRRADFVVENKVMVELKDRNQPSGCTPGTS